MLARRCVSHRELRDDGPPPRWDRDAMSRMRIALRVGTSLAEHENPGAATVQVLHGRVTLVAGENRWNGSPGDLMTIPDTRHSLEAEADSVLLLTLGKRS